MIFFKIHLFSFVLYYQVLLVLFIVFWNVRTVNGKITLPSVCYDIPNISQIDEILSSIGLKRFSQSNDYYNTFYNFTKTGVRLYKIKNKHIVYLQMRKAGSELINYNLETLAHLPYAGRSDSYQNTESSNGAKTTERLKYLEHKYSIFPTPRRRSKIFTFIREPLERFISGINEIYYRKFVPLTITKHATSAVNNRLIASQTADMKTAKTLLDGIMTGNLESLESLLHIRGISHVYPMSNNLKMWQLDIIGRIENISTQWKSIEEMYGVKLPLDVKFNRHRSSLDEFRVKSSLKQFLHDNRAYFRALCSFLQRDYDCFGIPLPHDCL